MMNKDDKKHRIMELWQTCFHDSDTFVDFYFSEKYKDENAIAVIENGQVLSALQMIPYMSQCWGKPFSVCYIAGASTNPDVQGRGLMSGLLRRSFKEMYLRGVAFSILIPAEPWLFEYYARFGYTSVYYENKEHFHIPAEKISKEQDFESFPVSILYEYFSSKQNLTSCSVLHDWNDFQAIIKDIELEGGAIVSVSCENKITALAFVLYDGNCIFIPDCLYDDEISKNTLFEKCAARFRCGDIIYRKVSDKKGQAYGMARIIRVEDMLKVWAALFPEYSCSLSVTDAIISDNNALFVIEKGKCSKYPLDTGMETIDIHELTSLLLTGEDKNGRYSFPKQRPSMSLMFS